jgi:hypothetical protein
MDDPVIQAMAVERRSWGKARPFYSQCSFHFVPEGFLTISLWLSWITQPLEDKVMASTLGLMSHEQLLALTALTFVAGQENKHSLN